MVNDVIIDSVSRSGIWEEEDAVVKVPLDARERSSCASSYWDPAFPHLSAAQLW